MRSRTSAIMLSLFLGFAQIRAEMIPDGIMPKDKRQAVGTGVTTTSDAPVTSDTPVTSNTPVATTSDTPVTSAAPGTTTSAVDPVTSDTPVSSAAQTTVPASTVPGTTEAGTTEAGTTNAQTTAAGTTVEGTTQDASTVEASVVSAESSTRIPTTIAVTTTNADGSTVTSQVKTHTTAPVFASNNGVASTDSDNSNIVRVGSSTINRSTLDHKTVITSALLAKETSQRVYTSFYTSDGQVYSSIVTENRVYSSTTGYATATIKPALANGGGDGSNLSDNAKQIIGGVVGGIGGAILVGGLAFVAWRLWGKKKAQREQPDEVWGGSRPDSIETAKRSSGMPAYDRYSNPNGPINTSSNF